MLHCIFLTLTLIQSDLDLRVKEEDFFFFQKQRSENDSQLCVFSTPTSMAVHIKLNRSDSTECQIDKTPQQLGRRVRFMVLSPFFRLDTCSVHRAGRAERIHLKSSGFSPVLAQKSVFSRSPLEFYRTQFCNQNCTVTTSNQHTDMQNPPKQEQKALSLTGSDFLCLLFAVLYKSQLEITFFQKKLYLSQCCGRLSYHLQCWHLMLVCWLEKWLLHF